MYGCPVNIVFTGPHYLFFFNQSDLFCVAEREDVGPGSGAKFFTIYVPKNYPSIFFGYATFIKTAQRIIQKHEQRHIKTEVVFTTQFEDVHKWGTTVNIIK